MWRRERSHLSLVRDLTRSLSSCNIDFDITVNQTPNVRRKGRPLRIVSLTEGLAVTTEHREVCGCTTEQCKLP
jgi:hypothetical protein